MAHPALAATEMAEARLEKLANEIVAAEAKVKVLLLKERYTTWLMLTKKHLTHLQI